jgi:hypothetical protein
VYTLGADPTDTAYLLGRQEVGIWLRETMARAEQATEKDEADGG